MVNDKQRCIPDILVSGIQRHPTILNIRLTIKIAYPEYEAFSTAQYGSFFRIFLCEGRGEKREITGSYNLLRSQGKP